MRILTQWQTEARNLYAVYPSDRYLSPKVRAFLDFILAKPPYSLFYIELSGRKRAAIRQ